MLVKVTLFSIPVRKPVDTGPTQCLPETKHCAQGGVGMLARGCLITGDRDELRWVYVTRGC